MKVQHSDTHTLFELCEPAGSWTLCIIDELWYAANDFFSSPYIDDPFNDNAQKKWLSALPAHSRIDQGVVAMMPVYCAQLPGLQRIVFTDFPSSLDEAGFLKAFLSRDDIRTYGAFLIDQYEADTRSMLGDEYVIPLLSANNIPFSRCAYFTFGGTPLQHPLPILSKQDIYRDHDKPIHEWWTHMQGKIDDSLFMVETSKNQKWHNPSDLKDSLKDSSFFDRLVGKQAAKDRFGVWRWVKQILTSDADLITKQYAHLCGKAFIKSGGEEPYMSSFNFTALRGLAMGLGWVMPTARKIKVVEEPPGIPATYSGSNIDNVGFLHECSTGKAAFEVFATRLRDWLQWLESDTKGTARLAQIKLCRGEVSHNLELVFTEAPPEAIFEGTGTGLVTRGWTALRDCFCPNQTPTVLNEGLTVRFTFAKKS